MVCNEITLSSEFEGFFFYSLLHFAFKNLKTFIPSPVELHSKDNYNELIVTEEERIQLEEAEQY